MAIKRLGPVKAAGVAVEERTSGQAIVPADMGVAALVAMFEKGKVGDLVYCPSKTSFSRKMGGRVAFSVAPDAAEDYWGEGGGAGELVCLRVTDGTEVTPYVDLFTRHWGTDFYAGVGDKDGQAQVKMPCLRVYAKNGGRWGGRQRYLRSIVPTDIPTNLAETTLQTGLTMVENEWIGATLRLDGVTSKTYEVISNTVLGVVTVRSDSTMKTDMGASVDKNYELELANEVLSSGGHKAVGVKVIEGEDAANEFGLEVWCDGSIAKTYKALSMDPAKKHYVEPVINDDGGNDWITVDDRLPVGITITPDHRPANFYGRLKSLSATKATFNVAQVVQVDDPTNAKIVDIALPAGADPWPHRLTFTWDAVVHKYHVTMQPFGQKQVYMGTYAAGVWSFADSAAWVGAKLAGVYAAPNKHSVAVTFDHVAEPATGKAVVIDVLPVPDALPVGGKIAPVAKTKNLTRFNVASSDYESVTSDSALMSAVSAAFAAASVVGTVDGPFAITGGSNDKLYLAMDGMTPDVTVTLTTGLPGTPTAAQVALDINTRYATLYGASVYAPASSPDGKKLALTSPGRTGKWSKIEIKAGATSAYAALGLTVGTTLGTFGQAPEVGSVTGSVPDPGPYLVNLKKLKIRLDSRTAGAAVVEVTFGANKTAAQAVVDINNAFTAAWGASPAPQPASVYTNPAGQTFVKLASSWYEGGGTYSSLELIGLAAHCYDVLGFTAATAGLDLKAPGVTGDEVQAFYADEPGGGHDGSTPVDQDYIDMLSVSASPLNKLADKGKGVVGIACPGVTSTAVSKAGVAYADAYSYHFFPTLPATLATEQDIADYLNSTLGRSDYESLYFPGWVQINDPDKDGVFKEIPSIGAVLGRIAGFARDYKSYVWPAAGLDAKLTRAVKLTAAVEDVLLNEELLTPIGINVIKKKKGYFVVWGARTGWVNSDWAFLTHRLQMSHYEHTFLENFDWVIFQLNDKNLWGNIYGALYAYFKAEWKKGALKAREGKGFEDACEIKIDSEINDELTEAAGDVYVEVGLRFPYFAERLILVMSKKGLFVGTSA